MWKTYHNLILLSAITRLLPYLSECFVKFSFLCFRKSAFLCILISYYYIFLFCLACIFFSASHSRMVSSPLPTWDVFIIPWVRLPALMNRLLEPRLWESARMPNILVQDGLEVSAIAEWRHFSRQFRLVSSASTIWVLCNVRTSSTTDIVFVGQRNSLLSQSFCVADLPVYLPDITRALCHHHYICKY